MKIVFWGTPDFALPTLQALLDRPDWSVVGVVTQPDRKRGRGGQLVPTPVKVLAASRQIPLRQPERVKKSPETIAWLQELQAEVFVVVAYGQILSAEILAIPPRGCINVHGSLLPAYRGAAPIQRCLVAGDQRTGITTMQMDIGMDTGDMLLRAEVPIGPLVNAQELGAQLAQVGAALLVETLIQNPLPVPQAPPITYAPPITKEEWAIDWNRGAIAIHNQVRGFYPDCYTPWRGQQLKILATVPLAAPYWTGPLPEQWPSAPAGTVVQLLKGQGPIVATGEGWLLLSQVQPPGKKPQRGVDLINGGQMAIGMELGV